MPPPKSSAATRCCSGRRVAVRVLVSVFGSERACPAGRLSSWQKASLGEPSLYMCGSCRRLGAVAVGSLRVRGRLLYAVRNPAVSELSCLPVRVGAGLNGVGRSLDAVCRHVVGRRAAERVGGTCCRTPAGSVLRIGVARRRVMSCWSTWSSRVRVAEETVALRGPGPGMGRVVLRVPVGLAACRWRRADGSCCSMPRASGGRGVVVATVVRRRRDDRLADDDGRVSCAGVGMRRTLCSTAPIVRSAVPNRLSRRRRSRRGRLLRSTPMRWSSAARPLAVLPACAAGLSAGSECAARISRMIRSDGELLHAVRFP